VKSITSGKNIVSLFAQLPVASVSANLWGPCHSGFTAAWSPQWNIWNQCILW